MVNTETSIKPMCTSYIEDGADYQVTLLFVSWLSYCELSLAGPVSSAWGISTSRWISA